MDSEGGHEDVVMELEGREAVSIGIRSALESSEKEKALSSEDLAWVDSCLVPPDSDVPKGGNWDMVRDALLDVLASYPDAPVGISNSVLNDEESDVTDGKEMEEKEDEVGDAANELRFRNAFLPTYKEGMWESAEAGVDDVLESGFVFNKNETEPSANDIFKVWELESLTEEGDFVTQLNKALKSVESIPPFSNETSYETYSLTADDAAAMAKWKGAKDESLDNLIAGIADLSLSQS